MASSNDSTWSYKSESSTSSSVLLVNNADESSDVDECLKVDFSEHFTTNMIWETMDELRDWVRKVGYGLCMVITTQSSKAGKKIILHCEESGRYRAAKKKIEGECLRKTNRTPVRIKKNGCPFLLHGIFVPEDYKIVPGWRLKVITAFHNHELSDNLSGHTFALRLTKEQKQKIAICSASGIRPKNIVTQLIKECPGTLITKDQVYSCKSMQRIKSMGNLNVTQYLLQFLKERGYFTDTLSELDVEGNLVLTDLFISHPDSRHLLRMFLNVVIMHSTYKTNMYGKPLLEFVGFTSTTHTYCIALVFMKRETTKHYTWALKRLKWLFGDKRPVCIMSDRELGAIKGVENVFCDVHHLLCQVHIDRNVKAYAKLMKVDPKKFSSSVRRVMRSHSKEEYEERLAYFRSKWKSGAEGGLLGYVESTWLTPHKEKLVCAWCDDILHFATRSSNRVESQHSMLKDMLGLSVGGFDSIVQHIDNMFVYQVRNIKEEMAKSTFMIPLDISDAPKWVKTFFKNLVKRVSYKCLKLLLAQAYNAKNGLIPDKEDPRDHWWSCTMGLPSPRRIRIYVEEGITCPAADIDIYWKQIKWDGLDNTDFHIDDHVPMSYEKFTMNSFVKEFTANEVHPDVLFRMSEKWMECMNPTKCDIKEPPIGETKKGRPRINARKTGTKRDKIWEEHLDVRKDFVDKEKEQDEVVMKNPPRDTTKKSSIGSSIRESSMSQPQDDLDCSVIRVHTAPPRVHQPSIIYLGFDWGSENIDSFMLTYISRVHDVIGDGHCGYRALAVLSGWHEGMYPTIWFKLSKFIRKNLAYWQLNRGS